jgi:Mrp family chromosome partitioning ATPase
MSIVAGTTFVAALIGLVLIPRQASRTAHRLSAQAQLRPDSSQASAQRDRATAELARIDSELTRARRAVRAAAVTQVPVDTLPFALRQERDSLIALLAPLDSAMARAADAPLPPSFRALGETPALRDNPQVRVWLDSLDQVDKLRAPFGALGAGDPIYVALTARVNEIGRSIRDAATERRSELRSRIAPLMAPAVLAPPVPAPPVQVQAPQTPPIDTTPFVLRRTQASRDYFAAKRTLDSMRAVNARIDAASSRARDLANVGAPPAAMLAAAFVIALAIGFTTVFAREARHPTIASLREAETVTAARVLTTIRPVEIVERSRRQADVETPPLIDIISESYRTLYLHLAATDASVPIITVTGDVPAIVATVATNLAAVAAYEARSTLLVDADSTSNAVAAVLRLKSDPGVAGILNEKAELTDAIVSTTIGRDRPLDVLPSGNGRMTNVAMDRVQMLREDFLRMERRYDFIVISAPTGYTQLATNTIIPAADVVMCARMGDTHLTDLRAAVKTLRGVGRYVHGLVLWDDDMPRLNAAR